MNKLEQGIRNVIHVISRETELLEHTLHAGECNLATHLNQLKQAKEQSIANIFKLISERDDKILLKIRSLSCIGMHDIELVQDIFNKVDK